MYNRFRPTLHHQFIVRSPGQHPLLELAIDPRQYFLGKCNKNRGGRNAAGEYLIQFPACDLQALGGLFLQYIHTDFLHILLPLRHRYECLCRQSVILYADALHDHDGPPQIPVRALQDPLFQGRRYDQVLAGGHPAQYFSDLWLRGGRHADAQAPAAQGGDDSAQGVGDQDQSRRGRVLLKGPAQGRLRLVAQVVCLVQNDHLEETPVRVLAAADLLDYLLHHDLVAEAHVAGGHVDVEVALQHCDLRGGGPRLETTHLAFHLGYSRAKNGVKQG